MSSLVPVAWRPGRRGFHEGAVVGRDSRSHAQVDDNVVGIVQIESLDALEDADDVAALAGVHALFVGRAT